MTEAFFGVTLRRNDSIFKDTFFEGCPFKFQLLTRDLYDARVMKHGATYRPFTIKWWYPRHHSTWDLWDNLVPLSHDVMHALDHFMKGRKDRLLKPDFGLGLVKHAAVGFTYREWHNEANVMAMQYAALSSNFKWDQVRQLGKQDMTRILGNINKAIPIVTDEVEAIQNGLLDYWYANYAMMHAKYKEMTHWINTQRKA